MSDSVAAATREFLTRLESDALCKQLVRVHPCDAEIFKNLSGTPCSHERLDCKFMVDLLESLLPWQSHAPEVLLEHVTVHAVADIIWCFVRSPTHMRMAADMKIRMTFPHPSLELRALFQCNLPTVYIIDRLRVLTENYDHINSTVCCHLVKMFILDLGKPALAMIVACLLPCIYPPEMIRAIQYAMKKRGMVSPDVVQSKKRKLKI